MRLCGSFDFASYCPIQIASVVGFDIGFDHTDNRPTIHYFTIGMTWTISLLLCEYVTAKAICSQVCVCVLCLSRSIVQTPSEIFFFFLNAKKEKIPRFSSHSACLLIISLAIVLNIFYFNRIVIWKKKLSKIHLRQIKKTLVKRTIWIQAFTTNSNNHQLREKKNNMQKEQWASIVAAKF